MNGIKVLGIATTIATGMGISSCTTTESFACRWAKEKKEIVVNSNIPVYKVVEMQKKNNELRTWVQECKAWDDVADSINISKAYKAGSRAATDSLEQVYKVRIKNAFEAGKAFAADSTKIKIAIGDSILKTLSQPTIDGIKKAARNIARNAKL